MLKTCKKCGAEKPRDEHHFRLVMNRHGNLYLVGACLTCEIEAARGRMKARDRAAAAEIRRAYRATSESFKAMKSAESKRARLRKRIAEAGGEDAFRAILVSRLVSGLEKMAHRLDWPAGEPATKVCWVWNRPGLLRAESYRTRYAMDEEFQIAERIRRQINKRRKRDGVAELMRGAIRRGGESGMVQTMLGYSIADLKRHLERQFVGGMNWGRFMAGEIHIDHIIPQASFNLEDEDQWRKCWCLSNLRPMWAKDNLQKSDKVFTLL